MTVVAVIPARFGAMRLPGKPLLADTGKFLIQHVYERATAAERIDRAIVATDDDRIIQSVESFGGHAIMTRADHASGTSRAAEAAGTLELSDHDIVLNVQGDEPEIASEFLDRLADYMLDDDRFNIGTLAAPFDQDAPLSGPGSPVDPNAVKVVIRNDGAAMYFSRSLVPYPRTSDGRVDDPTKWLQHMGIYAFRYEVLRRLNELPPPREAALNEVESLEQLAWLQAGLTIGVVRVEQASRGIDTREDYDAFVERVKQRSK